MICVQELGSIGEVVGVVFAAIVTVIVVVVYLESWLNAPPPPNARPWHSVEGGGGADAALARWPGDLRAGPCGSARER